MCVCVLILQKHDQGQVLLDAVFKHLELTERDYFGLYLADESSDSPVSSEVKLKLKLSSPTPNFSQWDQFKLV